MNNTYIDIGDICVDCGKNTTFGSGLFVNRIPADKSWIVNESFEIQVDGYLCPVCQSLECSSCKSLTMFYSLINNRVYCDSCISED